MQVVQSLCFFITRRVLQPCAGSSPACRSGWEPPCARERIRLEKISDKRQSTLYLLNKLCTPSHAASPVNRRLNDPDTWCPGRGLGAVLGRSGAQEDTELAFSSFLCSFLFLPCPPLALSFPFLSLLPPFRIRILYGLFIEESHRWCFLLSLNAQSLPSPMIVNRIIHASGNHKS